MNQEFLPEPSFSRGPSQAWEPRPGNSGLWAAPGTLLALPGGPVRERLIFLPPAVQKILPITPDRFGCRAGGPEHVKSSPAPPGSGMAPADPSCRPPHFPGHEVPTSRGPSSAGQCGGVSWLCTELGSAAGILCSGGPGSDLWTHSPSHLPRPRTGQQGVGGGAQGPSICLL